MPDVIQKFVGKKLLLLGTNPGTTDIINYARSQGAWVIVTDNQPIEKSAAKQIADEAWPVSTADVDTLEKLAVQRRVNGIFAGVSEFNLEKSLTLCERLGLPFYCTRKQWETCNNKQRFKQLCRDNDIPVPKEYKIDTPFNSEDLRQVRYPVIVKPVDKSAGTGIRICRNEDQLLKAYPQAVSLSNDNQAVVEEFIEGDEFLAGYVIKDGEFSLSHIIDKYVNLEPGEGMSLPQAIISPSKHANRYIEELNFKVIKMFQDIGLVNGFIFIQGLLNEKFYVFEANYRIDGLMFYRIVSKVNRINYMEMLVNHALNSKMINYDLRLNNPKLSNKCCCGFELVSRGGVVGSIQGLEVINNKRNLFTIDKMYEVGDYIQESGTLNQVLLRFYFIEDTLQDLKNSIKEIQENVKVLDDKGTDMLLPPFDTNRI